MSETREIDFFWDPICPFAWVTSRWVEVVRAERDLDVNWRFLSLALLNAKKDYETFPEGYKSSHLRGLKLLRVAAAVRDTHGDALMGDLYSAFGEAIWNVDPEEFGRNYKDSSLFPIAPILERLDLPADLAEEASNDDWDTAIQVETDLSLERTGGDTGTPVITFDPPDGPSFFGPVITQVPDPAKAVEIWDAFETLASWPSFSEVKRSMREIPQIPAFGFRAGTWTQARGFEYAD